MRGLVRGRARPDNNNTSCTCIRMCEKLPSYISEIKCDKATAADLRDRFGATRHPACSHCGKLPPEGRSQPFQRCGRCKLAVYCQVDCQRANWPSHKKYCKLGLWPAQTPADFLHNHGRGWPRRSK